MSGTNVVAVKKELFRRLALASGLAGVHVSYGWKRDIGREAVFGGTARVEHTLTVMRGGATRLARDERVILHIHIQVRNLQSDEQAADQRASDLLLAVEELVAGDSTLAGFANLLFVGVSGIELHDPAYDDDGVVARIDAEISYRSYMP